MVKEQNIALNPAKISGICGRLMCCMSFEHKTYKSLWAGLPGPGSKIKTPGGNYIVVAVDVAREAVTRGEEWEVPEDAVSDFDKRKQACAECRKSFSLDGFDFPAFEKKKQQTPEERAHAIAEDESSREGGEARKRRKRGRRSECRPEGEIAERQTAGPKPQEPALNEARKQRADGALDDVALKRRRRRRPVHYHPAPAEGGKARRDR
jgi:hypothetical protein